MAKEKGGEASSLWSEVFRAGIYKRNQGRIARQVTFFAIAVLAAVGCYQLSNADVFDGNRIAQLGASSGLFVVVLWIAYRLVNWPRFTDFLISVEAEMAKVSWPTRSELMRGSVVVLFTIMALAATLFIYDLTWGYIFTKLGVIGGG